MKSGPIVLAATIFALPFAGTSAAKTFGYSPVTESQAAVLRAIQHLTSTGVLSEIVRTHGLVERFQAHSEADAVGQLRNMIDIVEDNEAKALDVGVFSGDAGLDEILTAAVGEAGATISPSDPTALRMISSPENLSDLQDQQEKEVEAARVVMMDLMKRHQIVDPANMASGELKELWEQQTVPDEYVRAKRRYEQKYAILNFIHVSIIRYAVGDFTIASSHDHTIDRQVSDAPQNPRRRLRSMPAKFPAKRGVTPALQGSVPEGSATGAPGFRLWIIVTCLGLLVLFAMSSWRKGSGLR